MQKSKFVNSKKGGVTKKEGVTFKRGGGVNPVEHYDCRDVGKIGEENYRKDILDPRR